MKKAAIIFIIVFLFTALIPLYTFFEKKNAGQNNELVTIFSSRIIFEPRYNYLLSEQREACFP